MNDEKHLLHDIVTFVVIMGIIIASVTALFVYDLQTHFFEDFSKQVYNFLLR